MTYDSFLVQIYNLDINTHQSKYVKQHGGMKLNDGKLTLYHSVHVGGMRGGNCWNNNSPTYNFSDVSQDEREFKDLDTIVLHFCPNISMVMYKKIMELVKSDSFSEREYYGNSSEYEYQYISLQKLYDVMAENNLLGDPIENDS